MCRSVVQWSDFLILWTSRFRCLVHNCLGLSISWLDLKCLTRRFTVSVLVRLRGRFLLLNWQLLLLLSWLLLLMLFCWYLLLLLLCWIVRLVFLLVVPGQVWRLQYQKVLKALRPGLVLRQLCGRPLRAKLHRVSHSPVSVGQELVAPRAAMWGSVGGWTGLKPFGSGSHQKKEIL